MSRFATQKDENRLKWYSWTNVSRFAAQILAKSWASSLSGSQPESSTFFIAFTLKSPAVWLQWSAFVCRHALRCDIYATVQHKAWVKAHQNVEIGHKRMRFMMGSRITGLTTRTCEPMTVNAVLSLKSTCGLHWDSWGSLGAFVLEYQCMFHL